MLSSSRFHNDLASIEILAKEIDSAADPAMRAKAAGLIEAMMALHGAALERMVEIARANPDTLARIIEDDLIASLLVLYDLHPHDLETRIKDAVAKLSTRGTKVDVVSIANGEARLRLRETSHGCGSANVKQAVEDAIYQAAPDLTALLIEDAAPSSAFVPIAALSNGHLAPAKFGGS
jgi:hypothetical protein